MQALRLVRDVSEDGSINIKIPHELGNKVEVIILPFIQIKDNESTCYMKLQEENEFSRTILASEQEDVWNEI